MNKLFQYVRAECYKQLMNKTWFIFLPVSISLCFLLIYREFNKNILTGIQIETHGYNPYYLLNGTSLAILSLFLLPICSAIGIFVNIKQNESLRTWTNGLANQNIFSFILGKLTTLVVLWFCFLLILYFVNLLVSLTIVQLYPQHFLDYEINTAFVTIWFVKYYLSSLGAISVCFTLSLLIKNKTIIIIVTAIIPFIFITLTRKGYLFPLSYGYFSESIYMLSYKAYLNGETKIYTPEIISGYEILSILTLGFNVAFIYISPNFTISRLTKD